MAKKKVTVNPQTGETHTAKWPAILCVGAGIALIFLGALEKFTGLPLSKALEIGIPLLSAGGIGFAVMKGRTK